MKLFHISFFIADKHLHEVMIFLEGKAARNLEVKTVRSSAPSPTVVNKQKKHFKRGGRHESIQRRMYYIVSQALPEEAIFNRDLIKDRIKDSGGNVSSIGSCIDSMLRTKLIKRVGRDRYRRTSAKTKKEAA